MKDERTIIQGEISLVDAETLQPVISLNFGYIDRPSQLEKIRQVLAENNPDYVFLGHYSEKLNPSYSPLNP